MSAVTAKDPFITRDEREAIERLADAVFHAMNDVFDDPRGMNGGDPFEPDDKTRIMFQTTQALRSVCRRLTYGEPYERDVSTVRRFIDYARR